MKHYLAPALALSIAGAACAQNYSGTYSGSSRVRSGDTNATINYTLELSGGNAKFTLRKSGRVEFDNATEDAYGTIMSYLEQNNSVTQSGTWSSEGGVVFIRFNRVQIGSNTRNLSSTIRFSVSSDRTKLSSRELSPAVYGADGAFELTKRGGSGGSNNDAGNGTFLQTETGGNGNIEFGNGDRSVVRTVRFRMYDNGKFGIIVQGSYEVDFAGTWRQSGNTLNLTFTKAKIAGRDVEMKGRGRIELRNGKSVRSFTVDGTLESRQRSVELDFRANVG